jgi:hypothetical protein
VLGYLAPGDGGGGAFFWDGAFTVDLNQWPDGEDGGIVIRPNGLQPSDAGRWRRVYDGPINVKWFGAQGNATRVGMGGSIDTAAIQNAVNAAASQSVQEYSGGFPLGLLGSCPAVLFPRGHYVVDAPISFESFSLTNQFCNVISDAKAIVEYRNDVLNDIFSFAAVGGDGHAFTVHVRGIKFIGGKRQIYITNGNLDASIFQIDHCEFHFANDHAVTAISTLPSPNDHLSANLVIKDCKFYLNAGALHTGCDYAVVEDCLVYPVEMAGSTIRSVFLNAGRTSGSYGRLHLKHIIGIGTTTTSETGLRWVDNHGDLIVDSVRFGGEVGGFPIVWHYASPYTTDPFMGAHISIRNSLVFAGPSSRTDSAVIKLMHAVPESIVFEDNIGPAPLGPWLPTPIVSLAAGFNLDTTLATPRRRPTPTRPSGFPSPRISAAKIWAFRFNSCGSPIWSMHPRFQ